MSRIQKVNAGQYVSPAGIALQNKNPDHNAKAVPLK
jgi:hypothetical protein